MPDHVQFRRDTPAWIFQVWAAFGISNLLTGWGPTA